MSRDPGLISLICAVIQTAMRDPSGWPSAHRSPWNWTRTFDRWKRRKVKLELEPEVARALEAREWFRDRCALPPGADDPKHKGKHLGITLEWAVDYLLVLGSSMAPAVRMRTALADRWHSIDQENGRLAWEIGLLLQQYRKMVIGEEELLSKGRVIVSELNHAAERPVVGPEGESHGSDGACPPLE